MQKGLVALLIAALVFLTGAALTQLLGTPEMKEWVPRIVIMGSMILLGVGIIVEIERHKKAPPAPAVAPHAPRPPHEAPPLPPPPASLSPKSPPPEPPPEPAPSMAHDNRVYSDKSAVELFEVVQSHTTGRAEAILAPYKGKWLRVNGSVHDVGRNKVLWMQIPGRPLVVTAVSSDPTWPERLSLLNKDDRVVVVGKIMVVGLLIELSDAEFRPPIPGAPPA